MDLTKILKAGEKCKPGFHKMPDGSCMSDEEMKKKAEGVQKGKAGVFNGNAYVDPDGNPWGSSDAVTIREKEETELFTLSWASGGAPKTMKGYRTVTVPKKRRRPY